MFDSVGIDSIEITLDETKPNERIEDKSVEALQYEINYLNATAAEAEAEEEAIKAELNLIEEEKSRGKPKRNDDENKVKFRKHKHKHHRKDKENPASQYSTNRVKSPKKRHAKEIEKRKRRVQTIFQAIEQAESAQPPVLIDRIYSYGWPYIIGILGIIIFIAAILGFSLWLAES